MKRWERKPRARFAAAAAAAARHSASEPVRLAGNRPTNGRLSRASHRSITPIDFPRGIHDCRQLRSRSRHTPPSPRLEVTTVSQTRGKFKTPFSSQRFAILSKKRKISSLSREREKGIAISRYRGRQVGIN